MLHNTALMTPPLPTVRLPQNGPDSCLHRWFEAQAVRTPHATAVTSDAGALTWAELNGRANQVAHTLRERDIGPGALVAVCLERSLEMTVALLGALKAGAAYVPLDPAYPPERLAFMLQDTQAAVVITQTALRRVLPAHSVMLALDADGPEIECQSLDNFISGATPDDLAYVIYTSGSTGTPKGVPIAHRSACNNLRWRQETFPLSPEDRMLQTYSFSFDPSVWAFFWPLTTGARLVLPSHDGHGDSGYLARIIAEERISVMGFGPAMLGALLDEPGIERCQSLRHVFCGGEALPGTLVRRFHALFSADLHNVYGPTEATIDAAWWTCRRGEEGETIPIGHPLPHTQAYLRGEDGQTASVGELCLSGIGLSPGYLHRPELTAEKFISNPFGPGRLYRTGDLARRREDGALEYLGRIDQQVKLRGFRIELGEIEAALRAQPSVKEAAVLAREDRPGDKRLAAYVAASEDVSAAALASHLQATLPAHMIPADWVFLPSLPLTANGKVDRQALPLPDRTQKRPENSDAPPSTPTEKAVAALWAEVLGVSDIGREDHFFDLGGHSLQATRVVSRARAAFGIDLAVRTLFEMPTLEKLSAHIESHTRIPSRLTGEAIPGISRSEALAPSFSQQRLWFFEQWQPGLAVYNIPLALKLTGDLNLSAVAESLREIVRRHESLRTVFEERNGQPFQKILPPAPVPMPVVDLTRLPASEREAEAQRLAVLESQCPFDIRQDLMLRARLLRLNGDEHWLILTQHHIASDGWSVGVLLNEFSAGYEAFAAGRDSRLPDLSVQYADWAAWQREQLSDDSRQAQKDYWRRTLADAPAALELPTDRPRPAQQTFPGARLPVSLPAATADGLSRLGRTEGATLFMTLTAGLQSVLSRWSGQTDFVIGTPTAGRSPVETEELIGFFVNTLTVRADLSGDPSGREIVGRVREAALGAFAHADLPFEQMVDALHITRDPSRHPVFQVLFALQNAPQAAERIGGLGVETLDIDNGTSKFDLTLSLWQEAEGGLSGWWEYNTDLYDAATVARLNGNLATLLEGLAHTPDAALSRLPLLTETERHQAVFEFNQTTRPLPREASIGALFSAQTAQTPEAEALVWDGGQMTYRELDERSNGLAQHLHSLGVGPGALVGLCAERSPALIIALLGILKAGGAYLPLDPTYPADRLAFMLADAQPAALLAHNRLKAHFADFSSPLVSLNDEWPRLARFEGENKIQADSLAYVMYTSGSTGKPKAVPIPHRGVIRLVKNTDYASFSPAETFLQLAPISFDASTFEVWGSLLNGARLALFPPQTPSLDELGAALTRFGVTTLWLTAGLFALIADERLGDLRGLRQLLAGGDVLPMPQVRRVLRELPHCRLINGYGPTECTTFACCHTVTEADLAGNGVPIGRPIANTMAYVVDAADQPVPVGVAGELLLGGDGLSSGYLNRPELTAERFVPNPFGSGHLYRTGDLVRRRPDGALEFLGRRDNQVKIRGFRIELGEIEAALLRLPNVKEAVVTVQGHIPGQKSLAAYVVPADPHSPLSGPVLRETLTAQLPGYMVPASFTALPALPLTPNGKIDRRALPDPTPDTSEARSDFAAPADEIEARILALWEELLPGRVIGVRDSFFEIGGHSLLAVRMMHRLEQLTAQKVPLAALFEEATIAHLAAVIRGGPQPNSLPESMVAFHTGGAKTPLFFLHGDFGGGFYCTDLASNLGADQPLYALPPHGIEGSRVPGTIEAMASEYLALIRRVRPQGPYLLGGYCNGALIAFEIAQQLRAQGETVDALVLMEVDAPVARFKIGLHGLVKRTGRRLGLSARAQRRSASGLQQASIPLWLALKKMRGGAEKATRVLLRKQGPDWAAIMPETYRKAPAWYTFRPYPGRITLLQAGESRLEASQREQANWREIAQSVAIHRVPGNHGTCLTIHNASLAAQIRAALEQPTSDCLGAMGREFPKTEQTAAPPECC